MRAHLRSEQGQWSDRGGLTSAGVPFTAEYYKWQTNNPVRLNHHNYSSHIEGGRNYFPLPLIAAGLQPFHRALVQSGPCSNSQSAAVTNVRMAGRAMGILIASRHTMIQCSVLNIGQAV